MRIHALGCTAAAALVFAILPSAHAAERMQAAELASLMINGSAEFRGSARTSRGYENFVWRLAPNGAVTSEASMSGRLTMGGMGEQFGLKGRGTWRRDGEQICVQWDANSRRFDGCYGVLNSATRMVHLVGPQMIEGRLYGAIAPAHAVESTERSAQLPRARSSRLPGRR